MPMGYIVSWYQRNMVAVVWEFHMFPEERYRMVRLVGEGHFTKDGWLGRTLVGWLEVGLLEKLGCVFPHLEVIHGIYHHSMFL